MPEDWKIYILRFIVVVEKIHEFSLRGVTIVTLPQITNISVAKIHNIVDGVINEIHGFFVDDVVEKIHEFSLRTTANPSTTNTFNR